MANGGLSQVLLNMVIGEIVFEVCVVAMLERLIPAEVVFNPQYASEHGL